MAYALIARRGRVLMTRREGPLLAGLWEPPGVEPGREAPAAALRRRLAELGLRARLAPAGASVRHTITHRIIEARGLARGVVGPPAALGAAALGGPAGARRGAHRAGAEAHEARGRSLTTSLGVYGQ